MNDIKSLCDQCKMFLNETTCENCEQRIKETVKQKVEKRLKAIFDNEDLNFVKWYQNDIDNYLFCKITLDFIDSEQFRLLHKKFKPKKYIISISPVLYDDDDPPIEPYIEVEIQPVKLAGEYNIEDGEIR